MTRPQPGQLSLQGHPWWQLRRLVIAATSALALAGCGGGDSSSDESAQGVGTYGQVTLVASNSTTKNFIPCEVGVSDSPGSSISLTYFCTEGESGASKILFIQEDTDNSSRVYYDDVVKADAPDRQYKRYAVNTMGTPDDKVVVDRANRQVWLSGVEVSMWIHDGYGDIPPETVRIDGVLNY